MADNKRLLCYCVIIQGCFHVVFSMWKCDQPGLSVIASESINEHCSSPEEQQRNRLHQYANISSLNLKSIEHSSLLMIKFKVDRKFSKKVAWTSCVTTSTGSDEKCSSEFCQLIARKHFLEVHVDCIMMYPNAGSSSEYDVCFQMYKKIYISSFCNFHDIKIHREYLLFASEVTFDTSTEVCSIVNDMTYSHIFQYNSGLFRRMLPRCITGNHSEVVELNDGDDESVFASQCEIPDEVELFLCDGADKTGNFKAFIWCVLCTIYALAFDHNTLIHFTVL